MAVTAGARRGYPYIDRFRIAAALMVVAIHTSPLLSVSETADFVLARILCRVAVPFFFMAAGFFLAQSRHKRPFLYFARKTLVYYAVGIVLYLPLNLYAGHFAAPQLAARLVQDVVWNGTFYHLWYFPALLLGAGIAAGLAHLPRAAGLGVAAALYLVGLGGDSWYGIASAVPALHNLYEVLFGIFQYTRNGVFFAPLFVLLGMHWAQRGTVRRRAPWAAATALFLACMLAEALLLRAGGPLRHDSMYLFLPLCMWFGFPLLLGRRGHSSAALRRVSLLVYLLHPWCIVLVRGAAKALGLVPLLVQNSPVHYLCVCLVSLALAVLLYWLPGPGRRRRKAAPRAFARLDEEALLSNLSGMRRLLAPGCQVMAVVKADAYGHDAVFVARRLQKAGVRSFAVATLAEGVRLRRRGVQGEILVLGHTPPEEARRLWLYRLTQTVVDAPHAHALSAAGLPLRVQIKADTGMHRLGVPAGDTEAIARIYALPHLRVTGIYSHLARADSLSPEDEAFTRRQTSAYNGLLAALQARGIAPGHTHLQSTYGVLNLPQLSGAYTHARIGLGLYGTLSLPGQHTRTAPHLRPVLSLHARVASVRRVPAGEYVGYGSGHQCAAPCRIANLSIGYGDGIPRGLAGGGVLLGGHFAPIVGAISMDQLSVCVDDVPDVQPGDVATLVGKSGHLSITAAQLAAGCGTIANEVFTHIGPRVRRMPQKPAAAHRPAWALGKQKRPATGARHIYL